MPDLLEALRNGTANWWIFIPTAILLGALHGLEPGHSKTMMAAFIIAIRGTVGQAVLLGLSAAISHSLLIWLLAALALHYGNNWDAETFEPWMQIISAAMILGLAAWMYLRTRREVREAAAHGHSHSQGGHSHSHGGNTHHHHDHDHSDAASAAPTPTHNHDHDEADHHHHDHHHHHHDDGPAQEPVTASGLILPAGYERDEAPAKAPHRGPHGGLMLDTGHGWLEIAVYEDGVPPRFRVYPCNASGTPVPLTRGASVSMTTARLDGSSQQFLFEPGDGFWEATAVLPEPHEFVATITLKHSDHAHTYRLRFTEDDHHHHHGPAAEQILEKDDVYQDAHERAHAEDIARRFKGGRVTTPQIILFGITGGLMPCPAAFTILLVCLQIKKAALGFTIVGAFSFGLALTMMTVGAVAAWSVRHAEKRFRGFGDLARRAPYISCVLLVILAAYMAWSGWHNLHHA